MRNVIIMGSGPAGLTAAIYAARANLWPVLVDGHQMGGQLSTTTEVENYPGFRHAIMGPDLMKEMRAQAERFGTEFMRGNVTDVGLKDPPITLSIEGEKAIETQTLIIASGATAKMLGLKSERRLLGHVLRAFVMTRHRGERRRRIFAPYSSMRNPKRAEKARRNGPQAGPRIILRVAAFPSLD